MEFVLSWFYCYIIYSEMVHSTGDRAKKTDDFHSSDGNCNFSTYASLVYEISFSNTLYGRFYQDDESNRLNLSYGWSCGYRNGGCHGHGVEAVILMGDVPLLGVLAKYPVSWREGFGAVVSIACLCC